MNMDAAIMNTPEHRKSPSPIAALLWKEWQRQRWVFVVLLPLPVVCLLFVPLAATVHRDLAVIAVFAAMVFGCILPLSIGAHAFCGEEDDRSAEFGGLLPIGRSLLFWSKAALALALQATALGAYTATYAVVYGGARVAEVLGVAVALSIALVLVPAMATVFFRRTISCILATVAAVGSGALALMALARSTAPKAFITAPVLRNGLLGCAAATLLILMAGAWWIWTRSQVCGGRGRLSGSILRLTCCVLLGGIALLGWPAWLWAGETVFVTPELALGQGDILAGNASKALVSRRSWTWALSRSSLAVADMDTGEWAQLSRFHSSNTFGIPGNVWSPSGRMLCFAQWATWLWPFEAPTLTAWLGGDGIPEITHWVLDCQTWEARNLATISPAVVSRMRNSYSTRLLWWNDRVLAVWQRDGVGFVDLHDGSVRHCAMPADIPREQCMWWRGHRTPEGLIYLCVRPSDKRLVVLRFAPERAEASQLVLDVAMRTGDRSPWVTDVSADGRWAIVAGCTGAQGLVSMHLCSLKTGESRLLKPQSDSEENGLVASRADIAGFVLGGSHVLAHDRQRVSLLDLRTFKLKEVRLPEGVGGDMSACTFRISPSGRRARLHMRRVQFAEDGKGGIAVDFATGEARRVRCFWRLAWLDDARVVFNDDGCLWVADWDGENPRRVELAPRAVKVRTVP